MKSNLKLTSIPNLVNTIRRFKKNTLNKLKIREKILLKQITIKNNNSIPVALLEHYPIARFSSEMKKGMKKLREKKTRMKKLHEFLSAEYAHF